MNRKHSTDCQRKFEQLLRFAREQFPNENYQQSFAAAANSAAGAQLLATMKRAERPKVFVNAQSENDPDSPTKPREKYDPQAEAAAHKGFVDLTEQRALGDMRGRSRAEIWAHTSWHHPEGAKFYADWKRQALLKKREALAKEQSISAVPPHV